MNLDELIMSMYEKALERMYDIGVHLEKNCIYLYIQPHVETLTIDNDEETDESLTY